VIQPNNRKDDADGRALPIRKTHGAEQEPEHSERSPRLIHRARSGLLIDLRNNGQPNSQRR